VPGPASYAHPRWNLTGLSTSPKASPRTRFRRATQNRFISLGCTSEGKGVFAVYNSTGKIVRVVAARHMTEEEAYFYERRSQESL
jgi:uncharacterized DUF497 family protein